HALNNEADPAPLGALLFKKPLCFQLVSRTHRVERPPTSLCLFSTMILIIMVLVGVVNGALAMEALGGGLPASGSTYTNPLGGYSRPGTPVGPTLLNHQGVAMMQHVGPSVAEQQTALILQLQQQVQTLSTQLNQGGQPGMADFEFLSRYYQDPRAQQSPETGRFPFPRRIISGLPSGGINANNLVLLNYKAFPEWRDLEHAQRGQPDRAGSLLYEFGI
ncbi:hypothetical protein VaNZ11_011401, partial [Volvox africanus]